MSFWSGETIHQQASRQGSTLIQPYDKNRIDCASYKLSMGSEYYVSNPERDRILRQFRNKFTLSPRETFEIPSGQFAFLLTKESLSMPKGVLGFISVMTSKKYLGLVNVSGFHVDPGFNGKLVFAVYNAGPREILITEGEQLFLIWFSNLDDQDTKENRIDYGKSPQTEIARKLVQDMRGHPVTIEDLHAEFQSMKTKLAIFSGVLGTLIIGCGLLFAGLAVPWKDVYHWMHPSRAQQQTELSSGASAAPVHLTNALPLISSGQTSH